MAQSFHGGETLAVIHVDEGVEEIYNFWGEDFILGVEFALFGHLVELFEI